MTEHPMALDPQKIPRHVAIIMDGNGRWAQRQGFHRVRGHVAGAESVRVVTRLARKLGISYLTLFAFSEENWQRPGMEIRVLMALLRRYLHRELSEMRDNQIALKAVGDLSQLPDGILWSLDHQSSALEMEVQMVAGGEAKLLADLSRDNDAALLAHHDRGIHKPSVPHRRHGCHSIDRRSLA